MKKNSKLFIFIFAFAIISGSIYAQGFNSVYSKDGMNVIAVGNGGNVFRSSNGGATFGTNPLGSSNLMSVYAINQKVWIGAANGVYVSTDGGSNFNLTSIPGYIFNGIYFTDENTGWIAGTSGMIQKTTNGGANFTAQSSGVVNQLFGIKFVNANTGTAVGFFGTCVATTNGGTTWTTVPTGVTNSLLSVDFKGTTILIGCDKGIVLKSVGGGAFSTINYNMMTKSDVKSVSMIDPVTYYSGGGGGFVRKSTDAGVSFTYQINPMMTPLSGLYFSDANSGFAVSSANNAIMSTHDGGNTWTFQQGVTANYNWVQKQAGSGNIGNGFAVNPLNRDAIYIMMNNTMYGSWDRGETWSVVGTCSIGGSAHTLICSTQDTSVFVCSKGSSGGYVCRSTDHGVTWASVWGPGTLTSYGMPLEFDENTPGVFYLAPDNSVMLRSTNNGASFSTYGTKVFRSPCDIAVMYGNSNTMLVGDGVTGSGQGDFWKSTDNGVNWNYVHTVTGSEIPMIASTYLIPSLFYHTTWSSGGFWKSTDAGSNFNQTSGPPSNLWASDISKDDPNAAAYDQYGSTAYFTTDGGSTFITTTIPSSPAAGILYYDKSNLMFQHGGGVYKMTVSYTVLTENSQISTEIPSSFSLKQNYPNPFNPNTKISYNVSRSSFVYIKVYDVAGNEVGSLVNNNLAPGTYTVDFDASHYASGVYFYSLFVGGSKVDTKKMVLVK